ncbi:hotdog fold thioesterase [Permianibacter sp. IMCC34836]|uniref:hotdog fold thioesterase n=1 Tax=Permianibacter fluminis TaxID=2738515 RepID=UPI00155450F9|nr:hotdog fold thioesterase [Permianibacter fluminis]NQD36189.1 hotdog fold thioesterase [Permianibacter fluminis]
MKIWHGEPSLQSIVARNAKSMVEHLGIEFVALTDNSLSARMPVDQRTRQPFGLLHGGANVVLAETLGSVAGNLVVPDDKMVVGVEINANHLRAVRDGFVTGTTTPVHLGRSTQVWDIRIEDADGKLSCVSRLTLAVVPKG